MKIDDFSRFGDRPAIVCNFAQDTKGQPDKLAVTRHGPTIGKQASESHSLSSRDACHVFGDLSIIRDVDARSKDCVIPKAWSAEALAQLSLPFGPPLAIDLGHQATD
ncbi:hypothetical protein [Rhodopirellula islandica]|uniref:hypothetical protein n=1 Tax=Rhodopirellula islandica TaxID=595434 RepID=UPI001364CD5B|nr:hypothetical protein [Rhodopirellula islandica]